MDVIAIQKEAMIIRQSRSAVMSPIPTTDKDVGCLREALTACVLATIPNQQAISPHQAPMRFVRGFRMSAAALSPCQKSFCMSLVVDAMGQVSELRHAEHVTGDRLS
jgi:hypothetical protein